MSRDVSCPAVREELIVRHGSSRILPLSLCVALMSAHPSKNCNVVSVEAEKPKLTSINDASPETKHEFTAAILYGNSVFVLGS